ncbi:sodium-coupled monocarboxylate transporter 2-like isoform X1 [Amphiura filiformis]|uniref:sodium-coupled monocarboxylate transporter 2-like isoform X1 n=1 Tax=Amphiura filiformis TaxID=82378 RepID=UPI003B218386
MTSVPIFSVYDWVVFSLVMAFSASIGIYYGFIGSKQKTTTEYLLAGRSMGYLPVAMSLIASFFTGIYIQGQTADVYFRTGCLAIWVGLSSVIGAWIGARCFLPIYYRFQFISIYEYLELRFNPFTRNLGLAVCYLYYILHSGVATYAASLALTTVSHLDLNVCILILIAICIFYTFLGGMKAVLWADCFQMTLCFATLLSVVIMVSLQVGGFSQVIEISGEGGRTQIFEFTLEPSKYITFWNTAVFGFISWMPSQCIMQYQVQRTLSCKDFKTANIALLIYGIGLVVVSVLCVLAGLCLYAYYAYCDPYSSGRLQYTDGLLPFFIIDAFNHLPGLPGLLISSLCCLALSTVSSVLNSLSAITGEHMIKPFWPDLSDTTFTVISKALVVAFGVVILGVSFLMPKLGSLLAALLGILGVANGPILGVFTLGIFIPHVNTKGVLAGFFIATFIGLWIFIGSIIYPTPIELLPLSTEECLSSTVDYINLTAPETLVSALTATTGPVVQRPGIANFYALSRFWYTPLNFGISIVVGIVVSFLTGFNDPKLIDSRLICNLRQTCLFQLSMDEVDGLEDTDKLVKKQKGADVFYVETREVGTLTMDET